MSLMIICPLITWMNIRDHRLQSTIEPQASGAHCDDGIGAARTRAAAKSRAGGERSNRFCI